MSDLFPRDRQLAKRGIVDPLTGELTSYGEEVAEERYHGRWAREEGDRDPRFSEMGPDLVPGTNVVR